MSYRMLCTSGTDPVYVSVTNFTLSETYQFVGIATGYGLDGLGSIDFSLLHSLQTGYGAHSA
jgi:hypothetical protein